jgi:hypothetical protein
MLKITFRRETDPARLRRTARSVLIANCIVLFMYVAACGWFAWRGNVPERDFAGVTAGIWLLMVLLIWFKMRK